MALTHADCSDLLTSADFGESRARRRPRAAGLKRRRGTCGRCGQVCCGHYLRPYLRPRIVGRMAATDSSLNLLRQRLEAVIRRVAELETEKGAAEAQRDLLRSLIAEIEATGENGTREHHEPDGAPPPSIPRRRRRRRPPPPPPPRRGNVIEDAETMTNAIRGFLDRNPGSSGTAIADALEDRVRSWREGRSSRKLVTDTLFSMNRGGSCRRDEDGLYWLPEEIGGEA